MNIFIALFRIISVGSALSLALNAAANAQYQGNIERRCLSIADVNARVECFETGVVPSPAATSEPIPAPTKQQPINPSFDCRVARSSIERAICSDPTLSEWDSQMGQVFQQALQLARDRQTLLANQRLWLVQRDNSCGAVADTAIWSCLLEATKARASSLEKAIATSARASVTNQLSPPATTNSPTAQTGAAPIGPSTYPTTSAIPRVTKNDRPRNETLQRDDATFPTLLIALVVSLIVAVAALRLRRLITERKRFRLYVQNLIARFGEGAANRILAHQVWQGMTVEQLIESRGHPSDVKQEIIRERIKETWKYHQVGKNRFRERIYLENGIVIGWKH